MKTNLEIYIKNRLDDFVIPLVNNFFTQNKYVKMRLKMFYLKLGITHPYEDI